MVTLQRDMWDESGAYAQRPSSKLFDEWVGKAGGRVRGSLLELDILEQRYAVWPNAVVSKRSERTFSLC